MKVFISYPRKDHLLASRIASGLSDHGLEVFGEGLQPDSSDNWALEIGRALQDSDVMINLVTENSTASEFATKEWEYALTSKNYRGRVISVMVGDDIEVPWILRKLPSVSLSGAQADPVQVVRELIEHIESLSP